MYNFHWKIIFVLLFFRLFKDREHDEFLVRIRSYRSDKFKMNSLNGNVGYVLNVGINKKNWEIKFNFNQMCLILLMINAPHLSCAFMSMSSQPQIKLSSSSPLCGVWVNLSLSSTATLLFSSIVLHAVSAAVPMHLLYLFVPSPVLAARLRMRSSVTVFRSYAQPEKSEKMSLVDGNHEENNICNYYWKFLPIFAKKSISAVVIFNE